MMDLDLILDIIQILSFFVLGGSALTSTILYMKTKAKNREKETYDYIDDKFNEYLLLCLEKPYLDIFDVEDVDKFELTEEQKKEEKVAFSFLTSIFERVYIFYVENGKKTDCDQLENWKKTMKEYLSRENYRKAWSENFYGWDADFIIFMDKLYFEVNDTIQLEEFHTQKELDVWKEEYVKHFILDKNNDSIEDLSYYLIKNKKNRYHYYFIKHESKIVGGMLTQEIGNAVIILYLFMNKDQRRKNYASLALRKLKTIYSGKKYYLAEVEKRNALHKPFWKENLFVKVDFDYYTPEIDGLNQSESKAVVVNDLAIFFNQPVKTKALKKVIQSYFLTSFVKDDAKKIKTFKSVTNNNKQLDSMGKDIHVKDL